MPWEERRLEASELTVRLVEAPRPPPLAQPAEPLTLKLSPQLSLKVAEGPPPALAKRDGAFETALAKPTPPPPPAPPERVAQAPAPPAKARARDRKVKAKPRPPILAQSKPQEETFKIPPPRPAEPEARAPETVAKKETQPPPAIQAKAEAAREQAQKAAQRKAEEAARVKAEEAARVAAEAAASKRADDYARQLTRTLQQEYEAAREAEAREIEEMVRRKEEERRLALELEARRLAEESAKREAEALEQKRDLALKQEQEIKAREEALRIAEAQKQEEAKKKEEEAKRLALELEALKLAEEAARQQAIEREKARLAQREAEAAAARAKEAADRKRAEAEAAAGRERERLAALPGPAATPAPGALSGKELAAKALDQLRTPGKARDELLQSPAPPPRPENPRRRSILGVERDVGLRMYVESWRTKIERHGALNYRHWVSRIARDNPVVTVSIRSDGSLEDVVIHRSSGVRELDEAVRRIAHLHSPYSAFPPALATRYDVIEIRRVWFFDTTLKILDEM